MKKKNISYLYQYYEKIERNNKKIWSKNFFLNLLSRDEVFFFHTEKKMYGYLIARIISGDAEIISLAVDPKERGKGYAKELMDKLIKFAINKKLKSIILEVCVVNLPAINLYLDSGFKKKAIRKKYYKINTNYYDAIILKLKL